MITDEVFCTQGYDKYYAELAALGRMAQAIASRASADRSINNHERERIRQATSRILCAIISGTEELKA